MSNPTRYAGMYTSKEVCELFGFSATTVKDLRSEGSLPHRRRGTKAVYDKAFVDGVLELWRRYPAGLTKSRDIDLFPLYKLHWDYLHVKKGGTKRAYWGRRKQITDRCQAMVAEGRLFLLSDVQAFTGQSYPTTHMWIMAKTIVTVRVGQRHYMTRRYALYLKEIFQNWSTIAEASVKTGIRYSTITSKIRRKTVHSVVGPDGLRRLPPTAVASLATTDSDDSLWSIGRVADLLGAEFSSLDRAVRSGTVASVECGTSRRIPRAEVERWDKLFNHLPPEFEWLEALVMNDGNKLRTVTAKQAARTLGVSEHTVSLWSTDCLFPFFLRSFSNGKKMTRAYVYLYIFGLRSFVPEGKVRITHAREYLELCKQKDQVV